MSRMKEVYMELSDGIQLLEVQQRECNVSLVSVNKHLDALLHLMSDMMKLEDQIRKMEENIERRLSRMEAVQVDSSKLVDRIIEMTLVQAGKADQAVLHRAQSRLEQTSFSDPQSWAGEEQEDVWPPPGCDAMESRG